MFIFFFIQHMYTRRHTQEQTRIFFLSFIFNWFYLNLIGCIYFQCRRNKKKTVQFDCNHAFILFRKKNKKKKVSVSFNLFHFSLYIDRFVAFISFIVLTAFRCFITGSNRDKNFLKVKIFLFWFFFFFFCSVSKMIDTTDYFLGFQDKKAKWLIAHW